MSDTYAPVCASEHTIVVNPGSRLVSTRCARDAGHFGRCVDVHGRHWTRASELVRQALADRVVSS